MPQPKSNQVVREELRVRRWLMRQPALPTLTYCQAGARVRPTPRTGSWKSSTGPDTWPWGLRPWPVRWWGLISRQPTAIAEQRRWSRVAQCALQLADASRLRLRTGV